MIPSALGRCDILHVGSATPAFVVGLASLYALPRWRRWWAGAAVLGLVLIPFGLRRSETFWKRVIPGYSRMPTLVRAPDPDPSSLDLNQFYVSDSRMLPSALPCDRSYFSPTLLPIPTEAFRPECLDMGFYVGFTNVATEAEIAAKVDELRARAGEPLLMENVPLDEQFPILVGNLGSLTTHSGALWIPHRRHAAVTFAPIEDYVEGHYRPGAVVGGGRLRVWWPVEQ